jgi:hypothetical protein
MRALGWLVSVALAAGCVDSTYRCGTEPGNYACTDGLACDSDTGACLPCQTYRGAIACPSGQFCSDLSSLVTACGHDPIWRCHDTLILPSPDGGCQ